MFSCSSHRFAESENKTDRYTCCILPPRSFTKSRFLEVSIPLFHAKLGPSERPYPTKPQMGVPNMNSLRARSPWARTAPARKSPDPDPYILHPSHMSETSVGSASYLEDRLTLLTICHPRTVIPMFMLVARLNMGPIVLKYRCVQVQYPVLLMLSFTITVNGSSSVSTTTMPALRCPSSTGRRGDSMRPQLAESAAHVAHSSTVRDPESQTLKFFYTALSHSLFGVLHARASHWRRACARPKCKNLPLSRNIHTKKSHSPDRKRKRLKTQRIRMAVVVVLAIAVNSRIPFSNFR